MNNVILKTTLFVLFFCFSFTDIYSQTPVDDETDLTMIVLENRKISATKILIKVEFTSYHSNPYDLYIGHNGSYYSGAAQSYALNAGSPNTFVHTFIFNNGDTFLHPKYGISVEINCGIIETSGVAKSSSTFYEEEDSCIVTIGPCC